MNYCKTCKKSFKHRNCPSDISSGRGKYCSVRCATKSRRKLPLEFTCKNCKTNFPNKLGKIQKFCSRECASAYRKGNEEYKSRMNLEGLKLGHQKGNTHGFVKGMTPWNKGKKGVMPKPWNLGKGVKCNLQTLVRQSDKYICWRKEIYKKDGYRCKLCKTSKQVHAHHIEPFAKILIDNQIDNYDKAMSCERLWDVTNGETYCKKCHKLEHEKIKSKTKDSKLSKS